MSGTTIVTSTLPVAVMCTGTSHAVGVEPYSIAIEGTRGPDAVNNVGVTYDVDAVALGEWLGVNPEIALQVKPAVQADIDALTAAENQYGFELGLSGTTTEEAMAEMSAADLRAAMEAAGARRRQAEANIRAAEAMRKQADLLGEGGAAERDAAEATQKAALAALAEKQNAAAPARAEQHPADDAPKGTEHEHETARQRRAREAADNKTE